MNIETRALFYRWVNAREDPNARAESSRWLEHRFENINERDSVQAPDLAESRMLEFHAPLALIEGAWLEECAKAFNGHLDAVADLLKAYLFILGENEADSPAFKYRGLLAQNRIALPPTHHWLFAQDARIGEAALEFAILQLALGLNARTFFEELIGFNLAYAQSDSNLRLYALSNRDKVLQNIKIAAQSALKNHASQSKSGIERGFKLYQSAEADYIHRLNAFRQTQSSLTDQVATIIRNKLAFAKGYHGKAWLEGQAMDEWFAREPFHMECFLKRFKASQASGSSRPFKDLVDFGGPMFGVFDQAEINTLNLWLISKEKDAISPPPYKTQHEIEPFDPPPIEPKLNQRQWFYKLLTQDLNLDETKALRRLIEKMGRFHFGCGRGDFNRPGRMNSPLQAFLGAKPPFKYTPETLETYLYKLHKKEVARYKSNRTPKLNRQEYAWIIQQFAPTVLVDGCWLQNMGDAAHQDKPMQRMLYKIYADELGFGNPNWNHPNIFRQLLKSIDLELPPMDSDSFAMHPDFLDSAFDIPVYLLGLSQFPKSFLAELLGLNLAIELSGLGANYMHLADDLRFLKLDPTIVTLHQSIDNLAGGHSSLALKAIQIYLDEIGRNQGDQALQQHWARIWRGYVSLEQVTRRFKWALALNFCLKFLPVRLRKRLKP